MVERILGYASFELYTYHTVKPLNCAEFFLMGDRLDEGHLSYIVSINYCFLHYFFILCIQPLTSMPIKH